MLALLGFWGLTWVNLAYLFLVLCLRFFAYKFYALRLKRHGGGLLLMLCQKSFAARPHAT